MGCSRQGLSSAPPPSDEAEELLSALRQRIAREDPEDQLPALQSSESFDPRTDNRVAALDLATGALLWKRPLGELSDAHFEVTPEGSVVYPHYCGDDHSGAVAFDPAGKALAMPKEPRKVLAKSSVFWPLPKVRLSRGWELDGFSPGNSKAFRFLDPESGMLEWDLLTEGYPGHVRAWKDLLLYAFGSHSEECVLYAYPAGEQESAWKCDINEVARPKKPLRRVTFEVIGDTIYVEANEHVLAIDPRQGKLLWHLNLAEELDLPFRPGFFGGALNLAVFTQAGDILVVSFEKRVVALNVNTQKVLWHLQPDTFPHTPFAEKEREPSPRHEVGSR